MREKGIQTAWLERNCEGRDPFGFLVENGHRRKSEKFSPKRLKSRGGEVHLRWALLFHSGSVFKTEDLNGSFILVDPVVNQIVSMD